MIDLGRDWDDDEDGALLELGEVNDTFRVTVNGDELPRATSSTPPSTSAPACAAAATSSRSRSPPPCSTGCAR